MPNNYDENKLFDAMGEVDPSLVAEFQDSGRVKRRARLIPAIAACLVILMAAGAAAYLGGARTRSQMPMFYSVDGRLYKRATDGAAILLSMLPSSCGEEKTGEIKPVEITQQAEAAKTQAPDITQDPDCSPEPTEEPDGTAVTVDFNGQTVSFTVISGTVVWGGSGGDILIGLGTAYRSCKYREIINSVGIGPTSPVKSASLYADGEEKASGEEGEKIVKILERAESVYGAYFFEKILGSYSIQLGDIEAALEKVESVELELKLKVGAVDRSFEMTYWPDYGLFKDGELYFELTPDDMEALNEMLDTGSGRD